MFITFTLVCLSWMKIVLSDIAAFIGFFTIKITLLIVSYLFLISLSSFFDELS